MGKNEPLVTNYLFKSAMKQGCNINYYAEIIIIAEH